MLVVNDRPLLNHKLNELKHLSDTIRSGAAAFAFGFFICANKDILKGNYSNPSDFIFTAITFAGAAFMACTAYYIANKIDMLVIEIKENLIIKKNPPCQKNLPRLPEKIKNYGVSKLHFNNYPNIRQISQKISNNEKVFTKRRRPFSDSGQDDLLEYPQAALNFLEKDRCVMQDFSPSPHVCVMYVARPGPTDDNYILQPNQSKTTGRWSSSDDTPLAPDGIESAFKIAALFKDVVFDKALCSKAYRTKQTAEIILGAKKIEIQEREELYEMEIGPLEGKTSDEIMEFFKKATGYPSEKTKETLPRLWAKRNGELKNGNDCLLDKWHPDIDVFEPFFEQCIDKIINTAKENLGKTLLVVPHGTPMKSIVAKAKNVSVDRVICQKGAYYAVEIDLNGKVTLREEMMGGISIE